jgi:hypothetical protein
MIFDSEHVVFIDMLSSSTLVEEIERKDIVAIGEEFV